MFRAAQEESHFHSGMSRYNENGRIDPKVIRAGEANMFLSKVFREVLSCITGTTIHLYNTDGSLELPGVPESDAVITVTEKEAFKGLTAVSVTEPDSLKIS